MKIPRCEDSTQPKHALQHRTRHTQLNAVYAVERIVVPKRFVHHRQCGPRRHSVCRRLLQRHLPVPATGHTSDELFLKGCSTVAYYCVKSLLTRSFTHIPKPRSARIPTCRCSTRHAHLHNHYSGLTRVTNTRCLCIRIVSTLFLGKVHCIQSFSIEKKTRQFQHTHTQNNSVSCLWYKPRVSQSIFTVVHIAFFAHHTATAYIATANRPTLLAPTRPRALRCPQSLGSELPLNEQDSRLQSTHRPAAYLRPTPRKGTLRPTRDTPGHIRHHFQHPRAHQ